jgi:capsular exopolysaccharide synthesis family protein
VALISLKDFMNNKVGDIIQVKQRTDIPLLGIISHVKKLKSPVVINSLSRSVVAEQIRNIRTSISFTGKGKEVKTILVTSFQPGDGKSFVSLNLAAGYALLNKKTVMLDFDLRRPHISKDLGIDIQEGISSILTGKSTLDDLLVEVQDYGGHFFLLPAGYLESNPAELISGPQLPCLFKMLQERFDHIIINTPPFNFITDAALLQQYADITLIVLRQDHTSREVYIELKHRIASHPDNPVYLLLNDVGKRKRYQSGYGYGGYGYGYGKAYYHKKK